MAPKEPALSETRKPDALQTFIEQMTELAMKAANTGNAVAEVLDKMLKEGELITTAKGGEKAAEQLASVITVNRRMAKGIPIGLSIIIGNLLGIAPEEFLKKDEELLIANLEAERGMAAPAKPEKPIDPLAKIKMAASFGKFGNT